MKNATHSSILAWRMPWTEEPGGLQSGGHKESDTTNTQHKQWKNKNKVCQVKYKTPNYIWISDK